VQITLAPKRAMLTGSTRSNSGMGLEIAEATDVGRASVIVTGRTGDDPCSQRIGWPIPSMLPSLSRNQAPRSLFPLLG
jgi:hypothetical protein